MIAPREAADSETHRLLNDVSDRRQQQQTGLRTNTEPQWAEVETSPNTAAV